MELTGSSDLREAAEAGWPDGLVYAARFPDGMYRVVAVSMPFLSAEEAAKFMVFMSGGEGQATVH